MDSEIHEYVFLTDIHELSAKIDNLKQINLKKYGGEYRSQDLWAKIQRIEIGLRNYADQNFLYDDKSFMQLLSQSMEIMLCIEIEINAHVLDIKSREKEYEEWNSSMDEWYSKNSRFTQEIEILNANFTKMNLNYNDLKEKNDILTQEMSKIEQKEAISIKAIKNIKKKFKKKIKRKEVQIEKCMLKFENEAINSFKTLESKLIKLKDILENFKSYARNVKLPKSDLGDYHLTRERNMIGIHLHATFAVAIRKLKNYIVNEINRNLSSKFNTFRDLWIECRNNVSLKEAVINFLQSNYKIEESEFESLLIKFNDDDHLSYLFNSLTLETAKTQNLFPNESDYEFYNCLSQFISGNDSNDSCFKYDNIRDFCFTCFSFGHISCP